MRLVTAGFVTLGLIALVGCNNSPPGGSGNTKTSATGRSSTFKIEAPATHTTLKQGETRDVELTMDRGKDFHEDVDLKFDAPTGLTVDPPMKDVKAGDDKKVVVKVTAAKDAPVGDHEIKVTGTPKSGNATSVSFKIKVEKAG
jgi:uncharacterized membrane protein